MKLLTKKVPTSFNLFLFGDVHLGTILFNQEAFHKFLQTVSQPYEGVDPRYNFMIDHGDAIEAIAVDDKRYAAKLMTNPQDTPYDQAKDYVQMLWPVRNKIICRLQGNHERKLDRIANFAKMISDDLGVPYGTYTAKITYVDHRGRLMFKSYHTHGRKSITSTADDPKRRRTNLELILKRHLKFKAGDALIMSKGHSHKLLVCHPNEELYLVDDGEEISQRYTHSDRSSGYIHPDHRTYVSCGSFYNLFAIDESGYGEVAEYDPLEIGYVVVLVRNRQIHEVRRVVL